MRIAVIGAGVAGCSIVKQLQGAGYDTYLVDRHDGAAQETSSHSVALAHPHLTRKPARLQKFTRYANRMAYEQWHLHQKHHGAFQPLEQEDWVSREVMLKKLQDLNFSEQEALALDEDEAFELVGVRRPGIFYPEAGIYDLKTICHASIKNLDSSQQIWRRSVQSMIQRDGRWYLLDDQDQEILSADAVVLANGVAAKQLLQSIGVKLHLRPVRGQLSRFEISTQSIWQKYLPRYPLCGTAYCLPVEQISENKLIWEIGSTYDEGEVDLSQREVSDEFNREQGRVLLTKEELPLADLKALEAFVGVRSVSGDRLPLIGPIPGKPGLFMAAAYGARGVLWSAVSPGLIERQIEAYFLGAAFLRAGFLAGALSSDEAEFASAVAPARFLAGALTGRGSNSKPILPSG